MCETSEKMVHVHLWQDQGLGQAPFRAVALISLPSPGLAETNPTGFQNASIDAWRQARSFGVSLGSCDSCGMGLMNNVVIRDAVGKHFVVGCDCAGKTFDSKLITAVENLERLRNKAIREAKQEAARVERESLRALELDRQRAVNGGKTDSEVRADQQRTAAELNRQKMTAENEWLLTVLRSVYRGDFVDSMLRELEVYSVKSMSPRTISILRDIYAKSFGRGGSKKNEAAREEFDTKAGLDQGDE